MNELTRHLTGKFKPTQAVIVYNWQHEYYLESRVITDGRMMAGKPLTSDCIAEIVEFLSEEHQKETNISGVIPPNVLYCDWSPKKQLLVWYNPPMERPMYFTDKLTLADGTAYQPGIVYVAKDGNLHVFAVKPKGRPSGKDLLYSPPYPNCSRNGSVCLGNAQVKYPSAITYESIMKYFETLFWASKFSHLEGENSNIKGNLNLYWKRAIKQRHAFDTSILLPVEKGLNLQKLFDRL